MGQTGYEPNWSWAEMVNLPKNDQESDHLGTGSLFYKSHMVQTIVMS